MESGDFLLAVNGKKLSGTRFVFEDAIGECSKAPAPRFVSLLSSMNSTNHLKPPDTLHATCLFMARLWLAHIPAGDIIFGVFLHQTTQGCRLENRLENVAIRGSKKHKTIERLFSTASKNVLIFNLFVFGASILFVVCSIDQSFQSLETHYCCVRPMRPMRSVLCFTCHLTQTRTINQSINYPIKQSN